jgi:hypothetical protein
MIPLSLLRCQPQIGSGYQTKTRATSAFLCFVSVLQRQTAISMMRSLSTHR